MQKVRINCPKCGWEPNESCRWVCTVCNTKWNTFETGGRCPACDKVYLETACMKNKGGCGQMSQHADWYVYQAEPAKRQVKSLYFWKKKDLLPVTNNDRQWIEQSLLLLADLFDPVYLKSLATIIPDEGFFGCDFKGTEADAEYLFKKLIHIMNIDPWEIRLMFYSNRPTQFSDGTITTPQEKLEGSWKSSTGKYVDRGLGQKEIWVELGQMKEPLSLVSTLVHELAHYKLMGERRLDKNDELLTDLTAVVFGFGIFMGNSYFKFSQWSNINSQGWHMQKSGYLPEQVIAYAMAWLAYYRDDDVSWKPFLNKTMKKYFEQSYTYIIKNKDKINWCSQ